MLKSAVKFLLKIFDGDIGASANIVVAEAEGNTEKIKEYLLEVRNFIDKLIADVNTTNRES